MSPRKSQRTSAVYKRRLLEKKLELRRQRALRRQNKARSKSTEESEAAKTVHQKQKHLDEKLEGAQSHSEESLEWDDSNEPAPSFVTNSWESDQLEEALLNLYSS